MKYLGNTGLAELIRTIKTELKRLQEQIDQLKGTEPEGTDWKKIQSAVRNGTIHELLQVGDQLVCNHATLGPITWDVIGIDHDTPADSTRTHSLTLQSHDCLEMKPFSLFQASYSATEDLSAGNYRFEVSPSVDPDMGMGEWIAFSLKETLSAGGMIRFYWQETESPDSGSFQVFANRNATSPLYSGSLAIANDSETILSPINDIRKSRSGSNEWATSPLRAYLNGTGQTVSWTPATDFDRIPPWREEPGFLAGLESGFRDALGAVIKTTYLADQWDTVTTEDVAFLPSYGEVYAGNGDDPNDMVAYEYYETFSTLPFTDTIADKNRIKTHSSTPSNWRLRSPIDGTVHETYSVGTDGSINAMGAGDDCGVAPIVCIV